jgi:hypothetical protein
VSGAFADLTVVGPCVYRARLLGGGREVVEARGLGQVERLEDAALAGGELGALGDGAF